MSKISFLKISNFLGIDEQELETSKINIFRGPKGKGKSSVLEAIEKSLTNKNRRTEVVKHGFDEATIYVELDDGLEINRKIRTERSDYLKVRRADEGVPSTEKFLKSLVNGDIFRPIDWVNLSVKEQTESLLSMLEIGWSEQDIINWFGDLVDDIDYSQHILIILKNIELKYYKTREEVNREVKELKARIDALYEELPAEYDGEEWRSKNIQEYYKKVSEAQEINKFIADAKSIQSNFDSKIEAIKANCDASKAKITLKYKSENEDVKDIIELSKSKIEKSKEFLNRADEILTNKKESVEGQYREQVTKEKTDYSDSLRNLENEFEKNKALLIEQHNIKLKLTEEWKSNEIKNSVNNNLVEKENQKDLMVIQENKILVKQQELLNLEDKKQAEILAIEQSQKSDIEKEQIRIGKTFDYLEQNEEVLIEPLQKEAELVVEMVGYLKDWDRIAEIRDGILAGKEAYSNELTTKIDKARSMPQELLRTAKMSIKGISADVEGNVRIGGKLIDGLSDGEKLELSMRVAKAQCGELKVICMDKFESLDKDSQDELLIEMEADEYQYFVTEVAKTESGEIEIEKIG
ncbi:hypothetical protein [Clostridium gasigenes]|uniref:Rad50/SbcC-type AAA domain-containing protein n=1 Tax=Clostridium gasigenes TaxID=94869 RepID=A0A7X0SEN8_9CLOT|nr:hypothetical protein [Clostridium gasigenes]MBB6716225.1 hypothetical protein [Clostridium gasigenes]